MRFTHIFIRFLCKEKLFFSNGKKSNIILILFFFYIQKNMYSRNYTTFDSHTLYIMDERKILSETFFFSFIKYKILFGWARLGLIKKKSWQIKIFYSIIKYMELWWSVCLKQKLMNSQLVCSKRFSPQFAQTHLQKLFAIG